MKSAFKSFFVVTISVFICLVFGWNYLRHYGYSKTLQYPPPHPFLTEAPPKPWVIAYQGDLSKGPKNSLVALDAAAALGPEVILWIDLMPTLQGEIWLNSNSDDGSQIQLGELLERYPTRKMILNIQNYTPGLDKTLAVIINQKRAGNRILIQSDEDGLLRDLREQNPAWLFGTSQAQVTLLKMLSSLGLESLTPFKGDVYITPSHFRNTLLINNPMINEVHRRKMNFIAGPVNKKEEVLDLIDRGVDGIMTTDPSLVLQLLSK